MKYFLCRQFCTSIPKHKHFKLIIAGGGTGGSSTAHNFVNKFDKHEIALIEPADMHYYQPMWTLVGAGLKSINQSRISMVDALPKNITLIKDYVTEFNPDKNSVTVKNGERLTYDFLVVAMGIELRYDLIPGALEALVNDDKVVSNYSEKTVQKTYNAFKNFSEGSALFTFPNTPVKCAGAPQKVMYLFDSFIRKKNIRDKADIQYCTSLPVIFGIKKYADKLTEICNDRKLKVNTKCNLVEVDPTKHVATFENLDTKEKYKMEYNFLHITPPMAGYGVIKNSKLSDTTGFVAVNKETLQHDVYSNVFAIGDCSNLPTSKTAAAIASQQNVLFRNLSSLMNGGSSNILKYDGYTSCPLLTRYNKCILAEFGYDGKVLETFPVNQARESYAAFIMKAHFMPQLYWHGLIRGRWNGPGPYRKAFRLGMNN